MSQTCTGLGNNRVICIVAELVLQQQSHVTRKEDEWDHAWPLLNVLPTPDDMSSVIDLSSRVCITKFATTIKATCRTYR